MNYKTEYKVIEGNKEEFEKQLNELPDGWVYCNNICVTDTKKGLHYSILTCKIIYEN